MTDKTMNINETLTIAVPEGFQSMSREELKKLYQDGNPDRRGIWDKDRHVIITVSWKQYPALLSALADLKAVARRNQQLTEKGYSGHDYKFGGFFTVSTDSAKMEGYRFSYRLGSIRQSGETVLMKHRRTIYSITCVGREENADRDSKAFREILDSIRVEGA